MQLLQVGELLARIAVGDNRQVDHATIAMWHEVVSDLDFTDACEAVRRHRMTSADYLLPVHVRAGVKRIREERIDKHLKEIPPYPDPDDVRGAIEWERQWRKRIADGEVPPQPAAIEGRHLPPLGELLASPPACDAAAKARRGARAVGCSWCKAEPGQPCVVNDKPVSWCHDAREAAARGRGDGR